MLLFQPIQCRPIHLPFGFPYVVGTLEEFGDVPRQSKITIEFRDKHRDIPTQFQDDPLLGKTAIARGFASKFPSGKKVWATSIKFRERGDEWFVERIYLNDTPPFNGIPQLIGFLDEFPAADLAIWGFLRNMFIEDRALAGRLDGPQNASEVGRHRPKKS